MDKCIPAFLVLFLGVTMDIAAQRLAIKRDSTSILAPFEIKPHLHKEKVYHPDAFHNPRKALISSLLLPGLGQVYNLQYWKLPFVYGGFAGLAYSYNFAQKNYKFFLHQASVLKINRRDLLIDPEKYIDLSQANAVLYNDYYRRNRDLTVILIGAFWAVQAIDAYITGKFLHSFTMDNNLSFTVIPIVSPAEHFALNSFVPGFAVMLNW